MKNIESASLGARVTVVGTKYARAWPKTPVGDEVDRAVEVGPLSDALQHRFPVDAHFCQYVTISGAPTNRRLGSEALDLGVEVSLNCIVFDVDCPHTHGTPEPAPESWRREQRERVRLLSTKHPSPYWAESRGGGRLIGLQREPTILRSRDDARLWRQDYAIAIAYFEREFGIVADPACADWTRLFRLPHTVREPGKHVENWPTLGDPSRIGVLEIEPTIEDVEAAKRQSKAFRAARHVDRPDNHDGAGVFFYLLNARGWIVGEHPSEPAWIVVCPNNAEHTCGAAGDGSTKLYRPTAKLGAIHCKHGHCEDFAVSDWFSFFTPSEIREARVAAEVEFAR